eukprot:g13482.t1
MALFVDAARAQANELARTSRIMVIRQESDTTPAGARVYRPGAYIVVDRTGKWWVSHLTCWYITDATSDRWCSTCIPSEVVYLSSAAKQKAGYPAETVVNAELCLRDLSGLQMDVLQKNPLEDFWDDAKPGPRVPVVLQLAMDEHVACQNAKLLLDIFFKDKPVVVWPMHSKVHDAANIGERVGSTFLSYLGIKKKDWGDRVYFACRYYQWNADEVMQLLDSLQEKHATYASFDSGICATEIYKTFQRLVAILMPDLVEECKYILPTADGITILLTKDPPCAVEKRRRWGTVRRLLRCKPFTWNRWASISMSAGNLSGATTVKFAEMHEHMRKQKKIHIGCGTFITYGPTGEELQFRVTVLGMGLLQHPISKLIFEVLKKRDTPLRPVQKWDIFRNAWEQSMQSLDLIISVPLKLWGASSSSGQFLRTVADDVWFCLMALCAAVWKNIRREIAVEAYFSQFDPFLDDAAALLLKLTEDLAKPDDDVVRADLSTVTKKNVRRYLRDYCDDASLVPTFLLFRSVHLSFEEEDVDVERKNGRGQKLQRRSNREWRGMPSISQELAAIDWVAAEEIHRKLQKKLEGDEKQGDGVEAARERFRRAVDIFKEERQALMGCNFTAATAAWNDLGTQGQRPYYRREGWYPIETKTQAKQRLPGFAARKPKSVFLPGYDLATLEEVKSFTSGVRDRVAAKWGSVTLRAASAARTSRCTYDGSVTFSFESSTTIMREEPSPVTRSVCVAAKQKMLYARRLKAAQEEGEDTDEESEDEEDGADVEFLCSRDSLVDVDLLVICEYLSLDETRWIVVTHVSFKPFYWEGVEAKKPPGQKVLGLPKDPTAVFPSDVGEMAKVFNGTLQGKIIRIKDEPIWDSEMLGARESNIQAEPVPAAAISGTSVWDIPDDPEAALRWILESSFGSRTELPTEGGGGFSVVSKVKNPTKKPKQQQPNPVLPSNGAASSSSGAEPSLKVRKVGGGGASSSSGAADGEGGGLAGGSKTGLFRNLYVSPGQILRDKKTRAAMRAAATEDTCRIIPVGSRSTRGAFGAAYTGFRVALPATARATYCALQRRDLFKDWPQKPQTSKSCMKIGDDLAKLYLRCWATQKLFVIARAEQYTEGQPPAPVDADRTKAQLANQVGAVFAKYEEGGKTLAQKNREELRAATSLTAEQLRVLTYIPSEELDAIESEGEEEPGSDAEDPAAPIAMDSLLPDLIARPLVFCLGGGPRGCPCGGFGAISLPLMGLAGPSAKSPRLFPSPGLWTLPRNGNPNATKDRDGGPSAPLVPAGPIPCPGFLWMFQNLSFWSKICPKRKASEHAKGRAFSKRRDAFSYSYQAGLALFKRFTTTLQGPRARAAGSGRPLMHGRGGT